MKSHRPGYADRGYAARSCADRGRTAQDCAMWGYAARECAPEKGKPWRLGPHRLEEGNPAADGPVLYNPEKQ